MYPLHDHRLSPLLRIRHVTAVHDEDLKQTRRGLLFRRGDRQRADFQGELGGVEGGAGGGPEFRGEL